MLNRYNDCPLYKDYTPASPRCKKCKFFIDIDSSSFDGEYYLDCKIDNAQNKISSIIGFSQIKENPDNIAFEIIKMLVEKKMLN